ncbi:DNA methyltransferase [Ruegeria sp. HKCCA4812]|uniref:DNA methyltransferase n=1 Tax=Ruegeria sp. HKCCA4812 TaxID=2682993 RepID=UPI001C2C83F8
MAYLPDGLLGQRGNDLVSDATDKIDEFLEYAKLLKGDEKGEAQVFCDRLFQAFGHKGYKEAGAELEFRIKKKATKGTSFADLIWKPRVLIEMKRRGENLFHHYQQAFDYWIHAVPDRPRYVVLCNFDEFWIYDFDKQIDEPVDTVKMEDLALRYTALNFLFPSDPEPVFGNDLEAVSREAADKVAQLFNSLIGRGIDRAQAQRFVLQLVVAMFAEDIRLLPANIVYNIVNDCLTKGQSSFDLFGGLFRQMDTKAPAKGGRFQDVPYFNGGIFQEVEPIDLTDEELELIGGEEGAATKNWSKVNPAIFGTIFQQSMDAQERHAFGAHFTSEADILRIVNPTIVRPWREKIAKASTMKELLSLRSELMAFKVLDPACGSGNFLYLAYRELVRVEIALMAKLKESVSKKNFDEQAKSISLISPRQFYGIDRDSFGVELAKVTLMLAKKLAIDEAIEVLEREQIELALSGDDALPLDNLDANIQCDDALFCDWPEIDAIIGNPPYQSKNKMIEELGRAYVNSVRKKIPGIPGRADYCVYWFRKSHDHLKEGQRAGLVGTNTIRQNYSRIGGLDYILKNGGEITEAVSSQVWSGDAVVHVSIANWIKGKHESKKLLFRQVGDHRESPWEIKEVDEIGPSLSFNTDVSIATAIAANAKSTACYQGQTHGHEGFLLEADAARALLSKEPTYTPYLHPFMITDDLIGTVHGLPSRYVIDFQELDLLHAQKFKSLFARVQANVLADRQASADKEDERNAEALAADPTAKIAKDHANALAKWWQLFRRRGELLSEIDKLDRYIVCGRVTKRPIFEFISPEIRPNDSLTAFPLDDDYSFGILQSDTHWQWFTARCSTLKSDPRYTSNTVFDSFPWPQSPSKKAVEKVAKAAKELRVLRNELKAEHELSLRELYRSMELPGASPLKDVHAKLDQAVRDAYNMKKSDEALSFLLKLNQMVSGKEAAGEVVTGPGFPLKIKNKAEFVSSDCLQMPDDCEPAMAEGSTA